MDETKMYSAISRLQKYGVRVDVDNRTIFYKYQDADSELRMKSRAVVRLCKEFGFARQAEII